MRFKNMVPIAVLVTAFAVPVAVGAEPGDSNDADAARAAVSDLGLGWSTALAHLTLTTTEKQRIHDYVVQHRTTTQSDGESDDPRARQADEQELVDLIQSALSPANRAKFKHYLALQRARSH